MPPLPPLRSVLLRSTAGRLPGLRELLAEHDRLAHEAQRQGAELRRLRLALDEARGELEAARRALGAERTSAAAAARLQQEYAASGAWRETRWLGAQAPGCPLDHWALQELVHELDPALIVETATGRGGRALFLAHLCELRGRGEVVSVDGEEVPARPRHPRLRYLSGEPRSSGAVAAVKTFAEGKAPVLVLVGAAPRAPEALVDELRLYAPIVTPGSYLHVDGTHEAPARRAVEALLRERRDLARAERRDPPLGFSPGGLLRRRP